MAYIIPDADTLVTYLLDFTGSSDEDEIKQCIFQCELAMRNIELPALRTNPYETFGVVGANQLMPIPPDMNKPILFFQQGQPPSEGQFSNTGPWIVYDRVGDRDIITQGLVAQLYLSPVNVPAVIRGKFSEVGNNYQFLPYVAEGQVMNLYYYRAWNLLFTPATLNTLVSNTGTITVADGTGPYTLTIENLGSTSSLHVGDVITATPGTGTIGAANTVVIASIVNGTTITATSTGSSVPALGTITGVTVVTDTTIQTNEILQTWPEGYIYGTLSEYYQKRHSAEDAAMWQSKFDRAWQTVEYQNSLGKWSGGNTRLTSIFQPRQVRTYAVK